MRRLRRRRPGRTRLAPSCAAIPMLHVVLTKGRAAAHEAQHVGAAPGAAAGDGRDAVRPAGGAAGCPAAARADQCHGRNQQLQHRAARRAAGAHRAVSRRAADADPDGVDRAVADRRGEALAGRSGACRPDRRRADQGAGGAGLGPQREVADPVSNRSVDDERQAGLDAAAGLRLRHAAGGRAGFGAAAAPAGAGGGARRSRPSPRRRTPW